MADLTVTDDTAAVAEAMTQLLDALSTRMPEVAAAFQDIRVVFDTREQVLLLCPIACDGSSAPLLAIRCDPADTESFGVLAIPIAVAGAYGDLQHVH